jgi:acyl-coenzyme A synthetase/AMP-(fatty) acid ligase
MLAGEATGEARLRARLRGELPSFMQPMRYEWRDELPRNANGKLDRAAIAAALREPAA